MPEDKYEKESAEILKATDPQRNKFAEAMDAVKKAKQAYESARARRAVDADEMADRYARTRENAKRIFQDEYGIDMFEVAKI